MTYSVDFNIYSNPFTIGFECPHCGSVVKIKWDQLGVHDYFGAVECPECGEWVLLDNQMQ